jgi:nitrite reductase (NADH) small subunit/3-phenylpropionate/trans-cinnamate dioxygenase ferredoxin subunit
MCQAESSHPPADAFVRLLRLDQCRMDEGVFVEIAGRELAVFRLSHPPAVHVIDNACPHASGNLSAGDVRNGVVTCPWHAWKFRLCDGRSAQGSVARVRTYPVEIRGDDVYVDMSEPDA